MLNDQTCVRCDWSSGVIYMCCLYVSFNTFSRDDQSISELMRIFFSGNEHMPNTLVFCLYVALDVKFQKLAHSNICSMTYVGCCPLCLCVCVCVCLSVCVYA